MQPIDFDILATADRILIYGGSFDPPHIGHVKLSEQARQFIDADYLLVIPAGRQPLKDPYVTSSSDRANMIEKAFADHLQAMLVMYEIERNEAKDQSRPTYTFDTLSWLKSSLPDVEMRLLLGADQLSSFDKWYEFEKVIQMANPLVMTRGDDDTELLLDQLPDSDSRYLNRELWRSWMVSLPLQTVSSTEVREAIAGMTDDSTMDFLKVELKEKLDTWLSPDVLAYIMTHELYHELKPQDQDQD